VRTTATVQCPGIKGGVTGKRPHQRPARILPAAALHVPRNGNPRANQAQPILKGLAFAVNNGQDKQPV
jgi:hypothetical protein